MNSGRIFLIIGAVVAIAAAVGFVLVVFVGVDFTGR